MCMICVHQAHDVCICGCMCVICRGGRGPRGGCTLVYTEKYTDQEK